MKLMVPVNSLESCKAQINAGADEIYVGYRVDIFKKMNFSARPQLSDENEFLMPDKNEFREIVRFAKDSNVKVMLTANTDFFSDYPIKGFDIEDEFDKYILFAINCGVDNIIVSDVGLIKHIKQLGLPVGIHASTILDVDNSFQIDFLNENGVSRVVLSYQITYEEIKQLCENKKVEIEVFGQGGCSFGCYCLLGHGGKFGIPCQNKYYTEDASKAFKMIDSMRACSICSLWKLLNINVDVIKLIGRDLHYTKVLPITQLYKKAIMIASQSSSHEEYINSIKEYIPIWWKRLFCKQKQCKYEIIPTNRYSINIYGSE